MSGFSSRGDSRGGKSVSGRGRYRRPRRGNRQRNVPMSVPWDAILIDSAARMDPSELLKKISEDEESFFGAYQNRDLSTDPNKSSMFRNLLKILSTLCQVEDTDQELASRLLSRILLGEGNFASFMHGVNVKIVKIQGEHSFEALDILSDVIQIGLHCIQSIPQSILFSFPFNALRETVTHLYESNNKTYARVFEAQQKLMKIFEQRKKEKAKLAQSSDRQAQHDLPESEPPEKFNQISILPEIQTLREKPFLRPNIVRGCYRDWDHYLDIQFRLFHADFLGQLRDGINCLIAKEETTDIHIYRGVHILSPFCRFQGMAFIAQFDVKASGLTHTRWDYTKKLIYGSLLCLSNDGFKTMIYATVADRNSFNLRNGILLIKFEGGTNGFRIDPSEEFIMVESTAYFEAYRHVLNELQDIRVDQIPFTPYIVEGLSASDSSSVPAPVFLREKRFNLNPILKLQDTNGRIQLDNKAEWPKHDETCLDDSQLNALQVALSQELSVIQGPPGTGKTYIGLKIVEALLLNCSVWNSGSASPILVVCYTNHALDQFLEEIKNCSANPNVIRVGGRCKTESLANCTLRSRVQELKAGRSFPRDMHQERRGILSKIDETKEQLENEIEIATSIQKGKILSFEQLKPVMHTHHRKSFETYHFTENNEGKEVEYWLELWFIEDEPSAMPKATPPDIDAELTKSVQQMSLKDHNEPELITDKTEAQLIEDDRKSDDEDMSIVVLPPQTDDKQEERKPQSQQENDESEQWEVRQLDKRAKRIRINTGMRNHPPMTELQACHTIDIKKLKIADRWKLYRYWVNELVRRHSPIFEKIGAEFDSLCAQFTKIQQKYNIYALKGADVVGMTTTGAAKHNYILRDGIYPKVVVVEEAAEVFESHIITSLSPSVQQLVLIGDHKQLRPKPNYYELELKYNFHVSLFERLTLNDFPLASLAYQHRMRPEIASIVANHIYTRLENAPSVYSHPDILGVQKSLLFIDHNFLEDSNYATRNQMSHSNSYEADYLIAFCRYLLLQGYKPTQITILTLYRGQHFEIRHKMDKATFEGVRVAVVDDFQGEENDIILLSLVRSNTRSSIGFLNIENRICVALSRAKWGMFVIGNLSMLRNKFKTKWPGILNDLEKKDRVKSGVPLCCQKHPQDVILAETPEDFKNRPEGGCKRKCGIRIDPCGHSCQKFCHPTDQEHVAAYKCTRVCGLSLANCPHLCKSRCWKCKTKNHPPCKELVTKTIPGCNHKVQIACSEEPKFCPYPCENILKCGHQCQKLCSQECTIMCETQVKKNLDCGHSVIAACSESIFNSECQVLCKAYLECGHSCTGTCYECDNGRHHKACSSQCGRVLSCGHFCKYSCHGNRPCPLCDQPCENYCQHKKCIKRCSEPCNVCTAACENKCEHRRCTVICSARCTVPACDEPCKKILDCGHPCVGLCGEVCPRLCAVCHDDILFKPFLGSESKSGARFIELQDCHHTFEISDLDDWMSTNTPSKVLLKKCPKCSTPIRHSFRYENIVKSTLQELNYKKAFSNSTVY